MRLIDRIAESKLMSRFIDAAFSAIAKIVDKINGMDDKEFCSRLCAWALVVIIAVVILCLL